MYLNGHIRDIRAALTSSSPGTAFIDIPVDEKMQTLCHAMGVTAEQIDCTIAENQEVLRSVRGAVNESILTMVFQGTGSTVTIVGGDSDIDFIVNGHEAQVKGRHERGTNLEQERVSFKVHRTHGAAVSLAAGTDYLPLAEGYPEFLVGLVRIVPFEVLILRSINEIPRDPGHGDRLMSPFRINDYTQHSAFNAFSRLNVNRGGDPLQYISSGSNTFFPLTGAALAERLGLSEPLADEIILNSIYSPEHFRVWDMAIRGHLRETVFRDTLENLGVGVVDESTNDRVRAPYRDLTLREASTSNLVAFQVKGLTMDECDFDIGVVGVEVRTSHSDATDELRSRLYLRAEWPTDETYGPDFDHLLIALDPPSVDLLDGYSADSRRERWEFYAVPVLSLRAHHTWGHRAAAKQSFRVRDGEDNPRWTVDRLEIQQRRLDGDW